MYVFQRCLYISAMSCKILPNGPLWYFFAIHSCHSITFRWSDNSSFSVRLPLCLQTWGLMYKDLRGFLSKTLRTPKFGKLLRTNKSGCINPCVSTISRRFSLYIPINVKLCARARARLSAQSPPSFNMLISINRPAVVRLLGERR